MCNAHPSMIFICTCLFVACTLGDLTETVKIAQWLYHIKTEDKFKGLLRGTDDGETEIVSGMTRFHKMFNAVFVITPKLVVGILLAWYGSVFVAISDSNENAFEHWPSTLSVKLAELLFKAFTSNVIQTGLNKVPSITANVNPTANRCSLLCGPIFMCVAIGITVFTSVSVTCFCPVCGSTAQVSAARELEQCCGQRAYMGFPNVLRGPSDPTLSSLESCPAWYEAKNITMPEVWSKN